MWVIQKQKFNSLTFRVRKSKTAFKIKIIIGFRINEILKQVRMYYGSGTVDRIASRQTAIATKCGRMHGRRADAA